MCNLAGDGDGEADADALEAVENLLESYFVQIDGTFDKLEAIGAHFWLWWLPLHSGPCCWAAPSAVPPWLPNPRKYRPVPSSKVLVPLYR